eukprot:2079014-Pleurochrysis_carterae.AAC.1
MGIDVLGNPRWWCFEPGCKCDEFNSQISQMSDEERALAVVHHPRNHPGYLLCICGHSAVSHSATPERTLDFGRLKDFRQILAESGLLHLEGLLTPLLEKPLNALAEEARDQRTHLLATFKLLGVEKLKDRQTQRSILLVVLR